MVPKEYKNLPWKDAWFHMLNGHKIKRPLWEGYWEWENNTIMMHCRDGSVTDIRETDNPAYTFTNIAQRDWMVADEHGIVQEELLCDGCKFCGQYATEFPCNVCTRKEKDYYER